MESNLEKSLTFVFKFLSYDELEIVTEVNRTWSKHVRAEKILRTALCFTKSRPKTSTRKTWIKEKREIIRNYIGRSCLQIFFTNDKEDKNFEDKCHCSHLPLTSYAVNLEGHAMTDQPKDNVLYNLYVPRTFETKIRTFTFVKQPDNDYLHCNEIRLTIVRELGYQVALKLRFKNFMLEDSAISCMIILFTKDNLYEVKEMIDIFSVWFPRTKINIWGGITDVLTICQSISRFEKRSCRITPSYTIIFIQKPDMCSYVEHFEKECDTEEKFMEKLINFKERVTLQSYSIALMYISSNRVDRYFELYTSKFKELFPNVSLYPIYGDAPLVGGIVEVIMENLPVSNYPHIFYYTTIMLITFD
ncbi:hypothetical protein M0804_009776 [Polistes exclamans]|nr:hypothetical protein M0804_009776 [Polistes exclamans]